MDLRLTTALVATVAGLVAACGGQSSGSSQSGAAAQSATSTVSEKQPPKQTSARRYLTNRANKHEGDYEGPNEPTPSAKLKSSYRLVLTGDAAVRQVQSRPAVARVTLHGSNVCWQFGTLRGQVQQSAALGPVRKPMVPTTAAIHVGSKGRTGPVLVVLGARYRQRGCTVVRPVVVNAIASAPHFYYLSLATTSHPKGALRAQL